MARHGRADFLGHRLHLACSASSAAFAQNCTVTTAGPARQFDRSLARLAVPAGAASAAFAGAIGNVNTAFLSQQGSAFVSAPGNPKPDQPGGGVWVRGVGGEVTNEFTSASTGMSTVNGAVGTQHQLQLCATSQRQNFAALRSAQTSPDSTGVAGTFTSAPLPVISARNPPTIAGFSNNFEVPFFGAYLVATKGRFFADLMVRQEFYNVNLYEYRGVTFRPAGRCARLLGVDIDRLQFRLGQ